MAPRPLELSCAAVLAGQESGDDPTAGWRQACRDDVLRQHGREPHPAFAATFVLQWYLGAIADAGVHLAAAWPYHLPLRPGLLSLERHHPGGHPVRLGVDPAAATGAVPVADPGERRVLAHRDYLTHAQVFVAGFRPGVRLSSRHREGSVTDAWDAALATAPGPVEPPRWRVSCCYVYDLPGAHECRRCPRLRDD